ncbi:MAG: alpha/beta hydrolase-fold protein [Thermoanaerobaculia bacterium]
MTAVAEVLEALRTEGRAALDRLLEEREVPLHEGPRTLFLFQGEADRVELVHWIFGLESSLRFERVEGHDDLWHLALELPRASRIEYKLLVTRGDRMELVRDPLNDRLAHDPFGANSVCATPGYQTPDWIEEDPEARSGTLVGMSVTSAALGGTRQRLRVYLPPRFNTERHYPLLVVHDGRDYLHFTALKTVLDNLIYRLEIEPPVVALTQSSDRLVEYGADPRHAAFLAEELLPRLEDRFPVHREARFRGLMGASFGAVASLHSAWARPGLWGRLLLQSGSFAFTDIGPNPRGPAFEPVVRFVNAFREDPGQPANRAYVSCGQYESLIYENRSLVPVLQGTGMRIRYTEARDGHNWENWRDRLREGLSFLFPGPLWYVYE